MIPWSKRTAVLFLLVALFLSSCAVTHPTTTHEPAGQSLESAEPSPSGAEKTEDGATHEPIGEEIPSREETPPTTTASGSGDGHVHQWRVKERTAPECTRAGQEIRLCSCGIVDVVTLAALGHQVGGAGCAEAAKCTRCGEAVRAALNHDYVGGVCTRCSDKMKTPLYVLGASLSFDESASSIAEKLGRPTEILREGDLKSLVYASDLQAFTVIQTDSNGLWGVFTFDTTARVMLSGKCYSMANATGFLKDVYSETSYTVVDSCRLIAFTDPRTNANYALWFRYEECQYNYMTDSRLNADYGPQEKLSYYLINAYRAREGLSPYLYSAAVESMAEDYAALFSGGGLSFDHDGQTGNRLNQGGITWSWWGENISNGYENAYFVCDAYFHSPTHRANFLHGEFTHVGCGFSLGQGEEGVYGAQIYYKP